MNKNNIFKVWNSDYIKEMRSTKINQEDTPEKMEPPKDACLSLSPMLHIYRG
jgi:hypothetical protein